MRCDSNGYRTQKREGFEGSHCLVSDCYATNGHRFYSGHILADGTGICHHTSYGSAYHRHLRRTAGKQIGERRFMLLISRRVSPLTFHPSPQNMARAEVCLLRYASRHRSATTYRSCCGSIDSGGCTRRVLPKFRQSTAITDVGDTGHRHTHVYLLNG